MATHKPKPRPLPSPTDPRVKTLIEIPRAALADALTLPWATLVQQAPSVGWTVKASNDHRWCAKDHALVREGCDEMRGIPVVYFEHW